MFFIRIRTLSLSGFGYDRLTTEEREEKDSLHGFLGYPGMTK